MITNHTPRLTKVFLATDLNGDGSYSDSEFVYGSVHVGTGSAKEYLSALDSGDESATAIVTVGAQGDWKDSSGEETLSGSYFRITDNTVVSMEFVGSTSSDSDYYEGYGIGNGDIYPYLAVGDTALTAPDTTAAHKLGSKLESLGSAVTYTGAANSRGFTLPASTLYNDGAVTTYGSYTESTSESKTQQYLSLTLWDETKGTTVGTGSVVDESATAAGNLTYYTSFGSQYTVLNIPVYFDYVDDQAPEATITPFYWTADADGSNSLYYSSGSKRGHIDLDAYRTGGIPAVSGVIKLEGTAYDDQRIGSIAVYAGGTEIASISYDSASDSFGTAGDSSLTNTGSAGYYYLSASSSFSQSAGHTASWTLLIDTANALSNAESTALTVVATQAKSAGTSGYLTSTPGTVQTASSASTGYYQVAVLPYITEISRVSSTIAGGSMNRSKLGRYAVSEGESLYVYGYNFGTAATARVGSQTATVGSGSTNSSVSGAGYMTITVPAYSGNLTVTATTASENNSNTDPTISDNASTTAALNYNLESYKMKGSTTSYYADDDRYLEVWNMGSGFANTGSTTEFQQPVMTADTSGNLYASWGAASNGQIVFSYGVNGNATPIFNCYDQPAQYTAVAYDKYGTSGGASVMYMGEQQGAGGTYSSTGLSSSMIIGGAFVTNVPETYITAQTESTKKTNVVTGNPSMEMDGDNTTGFYNLSNYDMTRRLGSFSNPQAARYGSYLHNVWYDSNTESLRYSMINVDETNITTNWSNRGAAMANTVVLDGGYTGQDRVHTWTTAELTYETVTTASKKANNTTYYALSVNGTTVGSYSYTDKDVALATYINTSISNNYLTSGGKYHTVMAKGATGNYQANAMYFANDIFLGAGQPKVASRSLCISDVTATSLTMTNVSYTTAPAVGNTIALMVNDLGNYSITLRQITSVSGNTVSWSGAVANYADIDSATIYQGDLNVVNANSLAADGSYTGSSGSSAALDLTSSGYPVVAYFDDNSSTLRIAKATSTTPTTADNWVRTTTSLSCAGSVSLAVDSNSNIHVVYKDEDGQMCYAFGTLNTSTNKYTLKSEVIDATTSSDYTAISVVEDGTSVIPAVTYLANAGTAQSMKYAYRTSSPTASGTFSADNWDYMLLPLIGTGRYALSSNPVSLESRKTGWTGTGTTTFNNGSSYETATPATVQSVVAFKSKTKFETAYLRTEQ